MYTQEGWYKIMEDDILQNTATSVRIVIPKSHEELFKRHFPFSTHDHIQVSYDIGTESVQFVVYIHHYVLHSHQMAFIVKLSNELHAQGKRMVYTSMPVQKYRATARQNGYHSTPIAV